MEYPVCCSRDSTMASELASARVLNMSSSLDSALGAFLSSALSMI
jgi:hypothetical protein